MTYTLTVCYGMFLAICGQIKQFDFPSYEMCEKERVVQIKHVGGGWAACALKKKEDVK